MTQQANNEFDAAKLIVEALKGLDPQQQDRAIRFACESVGLQAPSQRPASIPVPTSAAPSEGTRPRTVGHDPVEDIKQFTDSKSPKTDQQFATVVAYYYRFVAPEADRKEAIGAEDLKNAARLAGRRQPANAVATLRNASNSGYLDNCGRGSYRINSVGENLVAITLPNSGDGNEVTKPARPRKRKPKLSSMNKKAAKPKVDK